MKTENITITCPNCYRPFTATKITLEYNASLSATCPHCGIALTITYRDTTTHTAQAPRPGEHK